MPASSINCNGRLCILDLCDRERVLDQDSKELEKQHVNNAPGQLSRPKAQPAAPRVERDAKRQGARARDRGGSTLIFIIIHKLIIINYIQFCYL